MPFPTSRGYYFFFLSLVALILTVLVSFVKNKSSSIPSILTFQVTCRVFPSHFVPFVLSVDMMPEAEPHHVERCSECIVGACSKFPLTKFSELHPSFFLDGYEQSVLNWIWIGLHNPDQNKRQRIFLDIGMNAGFFSSFAASIGARVLSFEPQPACIKNAAAAHSPSIELYNFGVSANPVTLTMTKDKCNPGNTILEAATTEEKGVHVPTLNLGRQFNISCIPFVDVVKIDVEGSELAVLESIMPLIAAKRIGLLIIEISNWKYMQNFWPKLGYTLESGVHFMETLFRDRKSLNKCFFFFAFNLLNSFPISSISRLFH